MTRRDAPRPTGGFQPLPLRGAARARAALRSGGHGARRDLAAALPGWVAARLLVLGALGAAHLIANNVDPALQEKLTNRLRLGLLSWDARWYNSIATRGYGALPDESLRFFPLLPLLTRALSPIFLGHAGAALLFLANGPALVLGALMHRLSLHETGDEALARRSAWYIALVPPFFVLVMGYAEAIALCLSVVCFLALRRRHWGWAALAAFFAGLTRPVGALLAVPAAIEGARGFRAAPARERLARCLAVLAPLAGVGTFLLWVGVRFGDPLLPLEVQNRAHLRGGFATPLASVWDTTAKLLEGDAGRNGVHLPWVVLLTVLVVVTCRRWPASFGAYAAVTVVVALSAQHLGSFERYGFGAFPVVLGLASVTAAGWAERLVLAVSGGLMGGYALMALLHLYIP